MFWNNNNKDFEVVFDLTGGFSIHRLIEVILRQLNLHSGLLDSAVLTFFLKIDKSQIHTLR